MCRVEPADPICDVVATIRDVSPAGADHNSVAKQRLAAVYDRFTNQPAYGTVDYGHGSIDVDDSAATTLLVWTPARGEGTVRHVHDTSPTVSDAIGTVERSTRHLNGPVDVPDPKIEPSAEFAVCNTHRSTVVGNAPVASELSPGDNY